MKFCTLLICCVLMVQNGIGQNTTSTKTGKPVIQRNGSQRPVDDRNPLTIKSSGFSAGLYEEVKKTESGNFLISPFSARQALVMLSLGAARQTGKEIRETLQFPNTTIDLVKGQSKLISSLKGLSSRNSSLKFVTADKIYIKSGLVLRHPYKTDVNLLGAEVENVDFGRSEAAAREINAWVRNKTERKIEKLVEASALNGQTSLLVLNAIYFKGAWKTPFKNSSTQKLPFFINGSCSVNVSMMYQKNEFQLADLLDAKAQVINFPYQGERLSMMIYLPNGKEESSLESLENWLKDKSPFDIQEQHLNSTRIQKVSVSLPKFKIRSSLNLIEPLKSLGLRKMFNSVTADFSDIFYSSGRLHVSKVSQETFIEVNEEGTEAAAATGIQIVATSLSPTPQFTVDRPFLFQIVHSETKTVLFSGRVKNPLDSDASTVSASQTEKPSCFKLPQVESTNTNTSKNIDRAQTGTNNSCDENQKWVEKMLISFCNLTSSQNFTVDLKNNLTTPVVRLEQCLAGQAEEKTRVMELNQNLTKAVQNLRSKVQPLELEQIQGKETKNATGPPTNNSTTQKKLEKPQGSFPPAAASGSYSGSGKVWDFTGTRNSTCFSFGGPVQQVTVKGRSCVAFYKAENCTVEDFRLDTTKSTSAQDMKIPVELCKSSKSIGVCY